MTIADEIGRRLPQAREIAERECAKDEMLAVRLGQPVKYRRVTLGLVEVHNALLCRYDELRAEEERIRCLLE